MIMHCINLQTHTKGHLKKESRCNYWRTVDQRRSAVLFIADSEHLLKHSAFGSILFTTLALQMNQLLLDHLQQRRLVNYTNRSSQLHCHSAVELTRVRTIQSNLKWGRSSESSCLQIGGSVLTQDWQWQANCRGGVERERSLFAKYITKQKVTGYKKRH